MTCMKIFSRFSVWFNVNVSLWLKCIIETESAHNLSVQLNASSEWPHPCNHKFRSRNRTFSTPKAPLMPSPSLDPRSNHYSDFYYWVCLRGGGVGRFLLLLLLLLGFVLFFACFQLCTTGNREYIFFYIWLFSNMQRFYKYVIAAFYTAVPLTRKSSICLSATVCSPQNVSSKNTHVGNKCIHGCVICFSLPMSTSGF